MALHAIRFRPGVNREQTQYTAEAVGTNSSGFNSPNFPVVAGWYASQNVRFRQGFPEKIGGWVPVSTFTYTGVCRSLFNWFSLSGVALIGVGTNTNFYVSQSGAYYDITPIRGTATLTNPFTATASSSTIVVSAPSHGAITGDSVTFTGATGLGGNITAAVLNQKYVITVIDSNSYSFKATATANSTDASGSPGGGTVTANYQISIGPAIEVPLTGWSAGYWGQSTWGNGGSTNAPIRLWSQANFGQDLIFCPTNGGIYYWTYDITFNSVGVNITSLSGASDCPTVASFIFVSDASRFVFAFGCNSLGSSIQTPMQVRWSDQESVTQWTPSATNQAGGIILSRGSKIVSCVQNRQEIVVFSDTSVYSFQYIGTPGVWGSNIVGDNISILSKNCAILANNVTYWMGWDKFYYYNGTVYTLTCDLREYIFSNINLAQSDQFFAGTNEGFNEIWWFYCSANSTTIDSYVIYNYTDGIWYYGQMGRTAWIDSTALTYPIAATYNNTLVYHENGLNDNTTGTAYPIDSYIQSAEFDIADGDRFSFVHRVLPDVTFRNSTNSSPNVTMSLIPMQNSGSGFNTPQSTGTNTNLATVTRSATVPIEKFTGQVFVRVRGRQLIFQVENNQLNTQWQLGTPRLDIKADGQRGST